MAAAAAKKRRDSASSTGTGAANGSGATVPDTPTQTKYRAACVRSGNAVVLGMRVDAAINCAGMALVRVFQGHVELLGFQPALGTYYSLYAPKWNSLVVVEGRTNANTRSEATKQLLDAAYQAPYSDASRSLLTLVEPATAAVLEMDEEHAADALAKEIAEEFPIVLVFRAIPVSFGSVTCYYESSSGNAMPSEKDSSAQVVLPGFKIIITKEEYAELQAATASVEKEEVPMVPGSDLQQYHDWKTSARVLSELFVADAFRTIQITPRWKATADAIETSLLASNIETRQQRIVVCGAKGVGKSTFCRYLVNRLLSHYGMVAFLDTDLGQSEFTPPGLVSLHALVSPLLGPGFTHMKSPLRAFFCGATNPGNDPLYYMQAVKSLLRVYEAKWGSIDSKTKQANVPLVINTDGWIKSMGHDLLCAVIQDANPDHVVQLLATTKNKQFTVPSSPSWRVHGVEPWDPFGATQPSRSSKDMRLYRWHHYFLSQSYCTTTQLPRAQLQNLHTLSEKNRIDDQICRAFARLTPSVVSFDAIDVSFAGSSVAPSQSLFSLNNSIVGLCINVAREPLHEGSSRTGPPRILLKPAHAPCLGVGLIRTVDVEARVLYVLSPLPIDMLARVNLLVRGNFPLEALILGSSAANEPYVVTDVLSSEGTGAAVMQSRNNIKRKRDAPMVAGGARA
ncbi:Polynucleotide 5'-hydroxyl-kinase nol9, partial [Globisporangium splendens]